MTISDVLMIISVLFAPFIAIFAQRKIDEKRDRRNQKLWVFRTLMATRGNKISLEHVQALNSIDLFFDENGREKVIIDKWDEYLDHLDLRVDENDPNYSVKLESWTNKSNDLLSDLLSLMGKNLGYEFSAVKIKKGIYMPKGHGDFRNEQWLIQKGFSDIMQGKRGFPVQLVNLKENSP